MFGPSKHFLSSAISRRISFLSKKKHPLFNETSKCLAIWNRHLASTENSEPNSKLNNGEAGRKTASRISEGLSHHYHEGEITLVELTAGKLLEDAVKKWPNRESIISCHQDVRLTYAEVLRRADKLAAGLLKLGLKRGDRVALWGPNEIEWFIAFMAMARAGFIMVGINPAYRQSEIDYCLEKVGARAVISPKTFKTQNYAEILISAKKTCSNLQHIIINSEDHVSGTRRFVDVESLAGNIEVQAVSAMQNEISSFDGCNIQFTSGTTGKPKACVLSHRSFVNNSKQVANRLGLNKDHHKICLNVPFFHAFGMVMGQFAAICSGSTIVLEAPSYNPKLTIEAIIKEKCTVNYGTPTMWINLLNARERLQAPIKTLRCGISGGSTISSDTIKKIREQLRCEGIQNIYGLTETTAVTFQSLPNESNELTENTVGHLSDRMEAMVVDDNGSPVPIGTPGELWVRGYATMMKYWDDELNTRKTLTEDGWLKTGDQFVLRSDGYGQIVGRIKDVIIRGGENIFPKEIEDFLETHPNVQEVHVFAVHDDVYGDEICACIRPTENSRLTANALREFAKGKISHFKIPRYIQIVEDFPRTTSGKIQKYKMRNELENRGIVPKRPIKK